MKYLLILLLLITPTLAIADTYSVLTDPNEQSLVEFFAARESRTNAQVVRRMCSVGIASFRGQYVKQNEEGRAQAIRQLPPARRAIVCAELATVGYTCPAEEP